jgi:hypothetical protein
MLHRLETVPEILGKKVLFQINYDAEWTNFSLTEDGCVYYSDYDFGGYEEADILKLALEGETFMVETVSKLYQKYSELTGTKGKSI